MKKTLLTLAAVIAVIALYGNCVAPVLHAQTPTTTPQGYSDRTPRPMPATPKAQLVANDGLTPPVPTVNTMPVGWVDVKDPQISGWSLDFDSPEANVEIVVTSETNGRYKFIGYMVANWPRKDINAFAPGNHGWGIATPPELCDGRDHVIHVAAYDIQTGEPVELPHADSVGLPATKPLRCGELKPAGTLKIHVTDETGSPLSTQTDGIRAKVSRVMVSGEVREISVAAYPGVNLNGDYLFDFDYNGDPLWTGDRYELEVTSDNRTLDRRPLVLKSGTNNVNITLPLAPLTVYPGGQPPNIASQNGVFQVPVLVCNNSYENFGFFVARVMFSGPGKYSDNNDEPFWFGDFAPAQGECWLYTFPMSVSSKLPDGHFYWGKVKVGAPGDEGYMETPPIYTWKGVKQPQLLAAPGGKG